MAYPAVLLINRAWNLSGIVGRGLETVSGEQGSDGLYLLNELLEYASVDTPLIPYWRRYEGVFVTGQEEYFIESLVDIETMTFTMDNNVRYPMYYVDRNKYFGYGRVNNITSIPFNYHFERELDGTRIYVYYLPDQAYTFQLTAKFALTNVDLNTDLTTVYDTFYISYLRYALASYMCKEYDIDFGPEKSMQLLKMQKKLQNVSPPDLTLNKTSFLTRKTALNWQQINLGRGFYP